MSESASSQSSGQEVEFREGCPSVDHVEAALRLGLEWRRDTKIPARVQFVVNNGRVCYDSYPFSSNTTCYPKYDAAWASNVTWRPYRSGSDIAVPWSTLDAEVARFKATTTTQRFNAGDAVMCSTFTDGTAGVRIAAPQDIARNLGVGKIEGCWQDHSRYRVRNLGTDELHVWPASALQGVDNWGLKVGDEVVTPRFTGHPSFVAKMAEFVDKIGTVNRIDGVVTVHGWNWPIYDVAVATARHRLKAAQVGVKTTSKQPEFRQLTRGIIEANPGQLWERNPKHAGKCSLYRLRYTQSFEYADELGKCWINWFNAFDNEFRPICAITKLPISWDELKPSLDEAVSGSPTFTYVSKQPAPHTTQETTMPTIDTKTVTTSNPTTDNQTTKKPSRGRLAIDAAKMRAPVELGLNRMHKIVAKKALKMFKGTRQEKAVVQRFLSDVLQSEYGKAFMGAAAATIVPYGASLPGLGKHADTLDAVADELAKRSATVLAVELGGTLLDAVEPLIAIVTDMVAKTAEGSNSVEVVDVPAETAQLSAPQQGSSPDFSCVASSMRCRTSA